MTSRSESASSVDWEAAEEIAERLGVHSRKLVGGRDPEEVIAWALRMEEDTRAYGGNGQRATSYWELAVLAGYSTPDEAA